MAGISIASSIDGWMSLPELELLAKMASKCQTIIEVGCFKGRSTRALADNCPGLVYAIDPWTGSYYDNLDRILFNVDDSVYHQFLVNISGCDNVITLRARFEKIAYTLPQADLIFIDADHRYKGVMKDIEIALPLIKPGGIIAGHDYGQTGWPGVKEAVDQYFGKVNLDQSIWWLKMEGIR